MEAMVTPDYERGLTFEKVWAGLQEVREIIERTAQRQEETAVQMKETARRQEETAVQMKETDRQMKETDRRLKKTERLVEKNGEQIGGLHNSFGKLAEHLVAPGIVKRFNELGYHFNDISPKGRRFTDENGKSIIEIDILLENTTHIMAVEVKSKPKEQHIPHHIKQLEILRGIKDKMSDKRIICGAIAGAIFEPAEKKAAVEAGLYVIEQSGDTMRIDVPEGFVPRQFV